MIFSVPLFNHFLAPGSSWFLIPWPGLGFGLVMIVVLNQEQVILETNFTIASRKTSKFCPRQYKDSF